MTKVIVIQTFESERDRRFTTKYLSYVQGTQKVIRISVELHSSGEVTQIVLETDAEGSETAGLRIIRKEEKHT
jgi:hypothetical protein